MGKQRVDAGLRLGRIEDEFGLAIFLLYCVVAVYCDLAERLAFGHDAIAEGNVVRSVADQCDAANNKECGQDQALEKMFDWLSQCSTHGVPLYRSRALCRARVDNFAFRQANYRIVELQPFGEALRAFQRNRCGFN
jgi:hypothetical protein